MHTLYLFKLLSWVRGNGDWSVQVISFFSGVCFVLALLFLFWDKVLFYGPGQPGSHGVTQVGIKLAVVLLLTKHPKCWSYRHMSPYPVFCFFFFSGCLTRYIPLTCFYILYNNHSSINAWHFLSLQHIEYRLKVSLPCDLGAALTDGVVLCHLANHVRPRSVPSIHVPSPAVVSCSARQHWLFMTAF